MTYQLIEDYSCNWPDGATALDPKGFAIHWWGDGSPQFMPIVNLLVNRAAQRSASVHFVAEEGRVACLTSPFEVAWAQGDGSTGWGNLNLVSIECNPRCTAGDRETVAELIADQHIRNGIPINLYPHKKFTATQCPGVWEQWIPWLTDRANQIVAEKTGKAEPAPVVPQSSITAPASVNTGNNGHNPDTEIHWLVESGDTLSKVADYYYAEHSTDTINKLASYNGISNPNSISVGQRIFIPGPVVWVVEGPDELVTIAAYYGMDADALAHNNGLPHGRAEIFVGQVLRII